MEGADARTLKCVGPTCWFTRQSSNKRGTRHVWARRSKKERQRHIHDHKRRRSIHHHDEQQRLPFLSLLGLFVSIYTFPSFPLVLRVAIARSLWFSFRTFSVARLPPFVCLGLVTVMVTHTHIYTPSPISFPLVSTLDSHTLLSLPPQTKRTPPSRRNRLRCPPPPRSPPLALLQSPRRQSRRPCTPARTGKSRKAGEAAC